MYSLQAVVQLLLQVFVLDSKVNAVFGSIVRRGINDGCKQAVAGVQVCQFCIAHSGAGCPLVILGAVVLGAVFVEHIVIAVKAELCFDFAGNNFFHLFSFPAMLLCYQVANIKDAALIQRKGYRISAVRAGQATLLQGILAFKLQLCRSTAKDIFAGGKLPYQG